MCHNIHQLTFDLVCLFDFFPHLSVNTSAQAMMWDCAFGGSTIIIHVEGATIPGAPPLPENLKAEVYIPPHILEEQPACHQPIAAIVQTFIEEVGVPTVKRWVEAAHGIGWSLNQKAPITLASSFYPHLIPPATKPGSARYIFYGRPYGSLPELTSEPHHHAPCQHHLPSGTADMSSSSTPTRAASPSSSERYFSEKLDSIQSALIQAAEKIAYLEEQLAQKEEAYELEIIALWQELTETFDTLRKQEITIAKYSSRHGITPTPSDGPAFASPSKPGSRHTVSQAPQSPHHFPKVDTSLFPQPYPGRDNTSLNLLTASPPSLLRSPPTPRAKSKRKQEEASAVLSNFGPATKNVISARKLDTPEAVLAQATLW
jgi:hypothetical protein